MYTNPGARFVAGLVLSAGVRLGAQEPPRLPAVVIKAPVEKPGPRAVAGVVRDTFAVAIDSVEVTLPDLQRRVLSDGHGKFRFDGVKAGTYTVRARKIGYAPQVHTVDVAEDGGVATFDLLQLRRALPPVVTTAARGGLSGVVGDTSYHALVGASVKLLGNGANALTDSLGAFYFPVRPGKYFLAVRDSGFADRIVSVNVPEESGRRVSIFLAPRTRAEERREHWNIEDFNQRIAGSMKTTSSIYTHEDLQRLGVEWLSEIIQSMYTRIGGKGSIGRGCSAVLNGGPGTTKIDELTIDDVETVEVYVRRSGVRLPVNNMARAAIENGGRAGCTNVFVWSR